MSYGEMANTRGMKHSFHEVDPFASSLLKFFHHKSYSSFNYELRASCLPFCARYHSLALGLKKKDLPSEVTTFLDDAILSTGHTFHAVLQRWMGMAGTLVGNWKCHACGKTVFQEGQPRCCDRKCANLGGPMEYVELNLKDKKTGLTAHPDGLFYTPKRVLEGLEFKTIVQANLEELTQPYDAHLKYQAATYARLVKSNLDLDVRHFTFVYIARNLPSSYKILYSKREGEALKTVAEGYSGKFTLMKMFRREIDMGFIDAEFAKIRTTQKLLKKYPGQLIPHGVSKNFSMCRKATDEEARFCSLSHACFSSNIEERYPTLKSSKLPKNL